MTLYDPYYKGFAEGLAQERARHDARVTELLQTNNREVERRREAEAKLTRAHDAIRSFCTAPPAKMSSRLGDLTIDSDGMRTAVDAIDVLWQRLLELGQKDYLIMAMIKAELMHRRKIDNGE